MIQNFKEFSPGIFRGGQPVTPEDWLGLRNLGITQVIKLNEIYEGSDAPGQAAGMQLFHSPISTGEQTLLEPDLDAIRDVIGFIRPGTFIHCSHGQDRTGLVVALFRVWIQRWPIEAARKEMIACGYHKILFGLEKAWADLSKTSGP